MNHISTKQAHTRGQSAGRATSESKSPVLSNHSHIMQLQKQIGNRAMQGVIQRAAAVNDIDGVLKKKTKDDFDSLVGHTKKTLTVTELDSFKDKHLVDELSDERAIDPYYDRYYNGDGAAINTSIDKGEYDGGKDIAGEYFVRNNADSDLDVSISDVNAKTVSWSGEVDDDEENYDNYEVEDINSFELSGNLHKSGTITINHYNG